MATFASSLADGAAASDTLARATVSNRARADGAAAVDALAKKSLRGFPFAEGAAAADRITVARPGPPSSQALAETATASDVLARTRAFARALADAAVALDGLVPHPYVQPPAPPPAAPGTGTGPGHLYEVVIVDKYGVPYGTIIDGVPEEVTWELDQAGGAGIRFPVAEATAQSFLPMTAIPGAREVQIWRDGVLIQWCLPVTPTFDNAMVTVQCTDHLFLYQGRNFGPLVTEYILNNDFEVWTGANFANWAAIGNVQALLETTTVNTGAQAARLDLSVASSISAASDGLALPQTAINVQNAAGFPASGTVLIFIGGVLVPVTYTGVAGNQLTGCAGGSGTLHTGQSVIPAPGVLAQDVTLTAPPNLATFFDVAVWAYIDAVNVPYLGPSGSYAGIVCHATAGSIIPSGQATAGDAVAQITPNTATNQWVRLECGFFVPAGTTATVRVELCAVAGSVIYDTSQMRDQESVGTPIGGGELADLLILIMQYAQDPARGKSDDNVKTWFSPAGPTGIKLERHYQFSDNGIIIDALNEMPADGYLDFAMAWDAAGQNHGVTFYTPVKGSIKYNFPIVVTEGNVIDVNGAIDGSKSKTTQRVLGLGSSGTDRELGYAAFPSYLGGRAVADGAATLGSTTVTSATATFTANDVGQGLYFLTAGVVPVGTVIASITNATTVVISNPATATATGARMGIGGIILDGTTAAQPDRPMATLPKQSTNALNTTTPNVLTLTVKVRADDSQGAGTGYFGRIVTGDVVPVSGQYGWVQISQLMRVSKIVLRPPTEEMEVTLIAVPGYANSFGTS